MSNQIMAICQVGLEEVISLEIHEKVKDATNVISDRGKIFFYTNYNLNSLLELKCVDNLYYVINKDFIGSHKEDLADIEKIIRKSSNEILNAKMYLSKNCAEKIIVSASRSGKHTYSRYDVSYYAENVLQNLCNFIISDSKNYDLSFRFDIINSDITFSLQLTSPNFKFRGIDNYNPTIGGIRPSLAHCLIRISEPSDDDVVLDPFCGAGTIISERLYYKCKKIYGNELNPRVFKKAKDNLLNKVFLFCGDACNLKIDDSISVIVTNLPWGKQVKVSNVKTLYEKFLFNIKNFLSFDAKVIVLTDRSEAIESAAKINGFFIQKLFTISLHGLHPSIYKITISKSDKKRGPTSFSDLRNF